MASGLSGADGLLTFGKAQERLTSPIPMNLRAMCLFPCLGVL
jgi:hypothetical protein